MANGTAFVPYISISGGREVREPREQLGSICGKLTLNGQAKMPELGSFCTSDSACPLVEFAWGKKLHVTPLAPLATRASGRKPDGYSEACFAFLDG
jgi:hypothetical protein